MSYHIETSVWDILNLRLKYKYGAQIWPLCIMILEALQYHKQILSQGSCFIKSLNHPGHQDCFLLQS